ncbi:hypothetical protein VPH35_026126 [Triticum aestivum]
MEHYPPLAHQRFPGELLTHGDPDLRPESGGGIIARTPRMEALEADFRSRALLATVGGRRPAVSPEALVQSLARICGVERRHVRVEVTNPADFFITFASNADCDNVFSFSGKLRCAGAPISFQRWHRCAQASSGKLDFFCKLGIEGMSASAWECGAIGQLINNLNGQLVEILPPDDRWQLEVTAWMRNPSGIPKIYVMEIPEPVGQLDSFDEEFQISPPHPAPPTERPTLIHPLTIHVLDVVERTVPYLQYRPDFVPEDDEDLTRRHDYSRSCFRGRIDGTGRGGPNSGAHPFAGPGGYGMAGDWGGGRRVNGVIPPAGGQALSCHPQSSGSQHSPGEVSSVKIGGRASGATLCSAATVVGSRTAVSTPILQHSTAPTAAGSGALVSTPILDRAALRVMVAPRRLSFSPPFGGVGTPGKGGVVPAASGGHVQILAELPLHSAMVVNPAPERDQLEDQRELAPEELVVSEDVGGLNEEEDMDPISARTNVLSIQIQHPREASQSPTHTPIAVPLEEHQLLPRVMVGPLSAGETIRQCLALIPAPSILGPKPVSSAPMHRKKTIPPNFTPRRSARLCKAAGGANLGPVRRAQTVLLRQMGVIQAEEQVSEEALEEYIKLFDKPLAPHHVKAVIALLAPDEVDFDEPMQPVYSAFSLPEAVEPCGV